VLTAGAKKPMPRVLKRPPSKYFPDDDELQNDKTPTSTPATFFQLNLGRTH
jgi:hypothetical protein